MGPSSQANHMLASQANHALASVWACVYLPPPSHRRPTTVKNWTWLPLHTPLAHTCSHRLGTTTPGSYFKCRHVAEWLCVFLAPLAALFCCIQELWEVRWQIAGSCDMFPVYTTLHNRWPTDALCVRACVCSIVRAALWKALASPVCSC